jgi:hypothetical protein
VNPTPLEIGSSSRELALFESGEYLSLTKVGIVTGINLECHRCVLRGLIRPAFVRCVRESLVAGQTCYKAAKVAIRSSYDAIAFDNRTRRNQLVASIDFIIHY